MTEQAKTTASTQEHTFTAPAGPYPPQPYNNSGGSFPPPPPGAYMPPLFAYPPSDGSNHPEPPNGAPAPPYMMALPPGVVYAYPPHGQPAGVFSLIQRSFMQGLFIMDLGFPPPPANAAPPLTRPKRKQVKMAVSSITLLDCTIYSITS